MKALLLLYTVITVVLALPSQTPFSLSPLQQLKDELAGKVSQKQILDMERIWINYQRQNGLETILKEFNQFKSQFQYSLATQDKSESTYSIEVSKASPELLGFDTVKQYTGYFNVNDKDKTTFSGFESRNDPKMIL